MARAFKCQKLLVISYMSGLVTGCSWSSRYIYTIIPAEMLLKSVTLQHLLNASACEINLLQAGRRFASSWQLQVHLRRVEGELGVALAGLYLATLLSLQFALQSLLGQQGGPIAFVDKSEGGPGLEAYSCEHGSIPCECQASRRTSQSLQH